MAEREILLSPEGKKNLEEELAHLKLVRRKEVAERIKAAREFGDLSENAEYEDAKNEQAFVEGRILSLEKILRHAKVAQEGQKNPKVVSIGCTVTVKDLTRDQVSSTPLWEPMRQILKEADIHGVSGGRALMGQKPGAVISVMVPAGTFQYEVVSITA